MSSLRRTQLRPFFERWAHHIPAQSLLHKVRPQRPDPALPTDLASEADGHAEALSGGFGGSGRSFGVALVDEESGVEVAVADVAPGGGFKVVVSTVSSIVSAGRSKGTNSTASQPVRLSTDDRTAGCGGRQMGSRSYNYVAACSRYRKTRTALRPRPKSPTR